MAPLTPEQQFQIAMAMIDDQIAQGNLQLNRDIYSNINLPQSYGGLTGMLPGGYPGYGGMPTFGSLADSAQLFGFTGNDPRYAGMGYPANTPTMAMRTLYHQLVNRQQDMAESQRRDVLDRQTSDFEREMEYGGGPVLNGQPVPAWMQPHMEWAREFTRANNGRVPTRGDLETVLSRQGRTPEDYAYPGNPGGWTGPLVGRVGDAAQGPQNQMRTAQATAAGYPVSRANYEGYNQGGGLNYAGSGYAQQGYGQVPMSAEQRRLLEQGRQFDVGAQLQQRGQDINATLQALQQESALRTDPFALERYRRGLNQSGVPNSIAAVAGMGVLPGVQGAQGRAVAPGTANQVREMGVPTFGMASAQQQMSALPQLNRINARNYMRLDPSGRRYVNSAYRASGMAADDDDIYESVRRGLPQFARRGVPTFGRVA